MKQFNQNRLLNTTVKMMTFCCVIILISTFTCVAISKPVISSSNLGTLKSNLSDHIFQFNSRGDGLIIDFDLINDEIETVNVIKNGEILRTEDVSEEPEDSIYELDIKKMNKGNYVIELITNTQFTISKEIAIN